MRKWSMVDEPSASPESATNSVTEEQGTKAGVGTRLREAREKAGLTVNAAAGQLNLDPAILADLEADRFDSLGAAVYVRGYVKRYADLLEIPAQPLLDSLTSEPVLEETPQVARKLTRERPLLPGIWSVWTVLAIGVVGAVLYILGDDEPEAPASPETELPVVQEPAPAASPPEAADADETATDPLVAEPEPEPDATVEVPQATESVALQPEPEPAPPPAAATGPQPVVISLMFDRDCWVNIRDRRRRLLFGLQKAGVSREISGQPPFSMLLGNARGVQIEVDGRSWPIPPASIRGNMAEFTIDPRAAN